MQIQCKCGKVKAELKRFPKETPGRLLCYCKDCQEFAAAIKRNDLLDEAGGTEVIPVYPRNFKLIEGLQHLSCLRLTPTGLFRWYTSCCQTPFGNTRGGFPWIGLTPAVFVGYDIKKNLGPVRSRVAGRHATQTPPPGTSDNLRFKDALVVLPFVVKGFLLGRKTPSPFFKEDGKTPFKEPEVKNP